MPHPSDKSPAAPSVPPATAAGAAVPGAPVPDAPVPDALVPGAPVPDALVPDGPVPDGPVPAAAPAAPDPAARLTAPDAAPAGTRTPRGPVVAWALWDWGSAAFNAVVTTFVFTRWLTSDAFVDPAVVARADDGGAGAGAALDSALAQHSTWLGWGLTAAGVLVALLAPLAGSRADGAARRRRGLAVQTGITVLLCAAMALVRPQADALTQNLLLGITLLAVATLTFELASVHYNALLPAVATPATLGRVSGIGWGAGYLGGIVLLAVLLVGFIQPDVGWFGVTADGGANIRAAVLAAALWFGVFAVPVLVAVPEPAARPRTGRRPGLAASYRRIGRDVATLWRESRATVGFLVASAVYRDGLAGVFTFGAVIASGTFGFSASEVVLFAVAANVVAGISTIVSGHLDDRVGARRIILAALGGLVVAGVATFALSGAGQAAFWVCGLLLCVFVGPAQSASRSMLARLTPPGRESEMFGLYATTGRAASFLAPFAFSTFVAVSGSQRWGILGIVLVIAVGLVALLLVRPDRARPEAAGAPVRP